MTIRSSDLVSVSKQPSSQAEFRTAAQTQRSVLRWPLLLAAGLLWLLFSAYVIQYSERYGRLLFPPRYNDVNYMIDGLQRLDSFYQSDLRSLITKYAENPPHSPVYSIFAAAGFAIFGVNEKAPYLVNSLALLALFGLVLFNLRRSPNYVLATALVLTLFTPAAFASVHEFQPDCLHGVFLVLGISLFYTALFYSSGSPRNLIFGASGASFGIALVAKPPMFPYALAIAAACLFARLFIGMVQKKESARDGLTPANYVFFAGALALVAAPHYIVARELIVSYIYDNAVQDRKVWELAGGWASNLLYPFSGLSGKTYLGRYRSIFLALSLAGLTLSFFQRNNRWTIAIWWHACASLLLICLLSFISLDNAAFGLPFQFCLMITSFLSLAFICEFLDAKGSMPKALAVAACAALLISGARKFGPPAAWNFRKDQTLEQITWRQEVPRKIFEAIHAARQIQKGSIIYFTFNGENVNAQAIEWCAAKTRRLSGEGFPYVCLTASNLPFPELLGQSSINTHFIITCETAAFDAPLRIHPTNKYGSEFVQWFSKHADFKPLIEIPDPFGKKYIVFMRK